MIIAFVFAFTGTVNCFAYTKYKVLAYDDNLKKFTPYRGVEPEGINEISNDIFEKLVGYSLDTDNHFITRIITDEYKLINNTAMVKVRDIVSAVGGSIEYNPKTKTVKAYIPNFSQDYNQILENRNAIQSFSITSGRKKVDFTIISYDVYGMGENYPFGVECGFKITPTIIDDSLYVSAIDLGDIFNNYYVTYRYAGVIHSDTISANLINGILYIDVLSYQ